MNEDSPRRAAAHLSSLLYADLDIDLQPSQIETFIRQRWTRIAPLAHAIHDAPDETKATLAGRSVVEAERRKDAAGRLRLLAVSYSMNNLGGISTELMRIAKDLEA